MVLWAINQVATEDVSANDWAGIAAQLADEGMTDSQIAWAIGAMRFARAE